MKYVEVRYLCVTGGSGSTRMNLDEVPAWLDQHPGYMIIGIVENA